MELSGKHNFKKGDLVRLCTQIETVGKDFEEIDWMYGIYIDTRVYFHSFDGFVDCAEEYDRILYAGRIMECDHYWYIERVSK